MNPFATHLPFLMQCLIRTRGPILELGSGWHSTPLITAFSHDRKAVTIESDPEYFGRVPYWLRAANLGQHEFILGDYGDHLDDLLSRRTCWDVVLADHAPGDRRGIDILRLRSNSRFIVAHDTEPQHRIGYNYARVFDAFKYSITDHTQEPWTTVFSDEKLDWISIHKAEPN